MIDTEQTLQDIVRVAQSGRDFFVDIGSRAVEREVRETFAYVADVKKRLIESLAAWTPAPPPSRRASGIVAAVEKLYRDVRHHFRGDAPASVAHALTFGEDQLIKLTERAFEGTRVPALRQLLKSYYSELSICQQAMSRLRTHLAA
ncbi:MAG TPA: hypothetical protein VFI49_13500 [Rudaea sp.]|nr:hypothetical protein [Rudaea sp.]